jgi:DnaJ-class molecular chaperone
MQAAAENIEKRAKELEKQYQDYEEKYHNDMLNMMQEAVLKYREITTNAQEESDHAL